MKYIYKLRVLLYTSSNNFGRMSQYYKTNVEADGINIGAGNYEFYEQRHRALNKPITYYPINNTIIEEIITKTTEDESI